MAQEPATIGLIAARAGITQPAATQTIALMLKDGLITAEPGAKDGRQKVIRLSDAGREMIPHSLAAKPFGARIADARTSQSRLPQPAEQKDCKK